MLNARSEKALVGVHPDLVAVVRRAAELMPGGFIITEGLRTKERQRELFAKGLSKTMNSRHLVGLAVDFAPIVDGQVNWKWAAAERVAATFKKAATELKTPIVWGGNWKTFKDGVHIELDRRVYK